MQQAELASMIIPWSAMPDMDRQPTPVPTAAAIAALLAPTPGRGPTVAFRRDQVRAAVARLAAARAAIACYLPRHLVARERAARTADPWLEWIEGALLVADVSGSTALAEQLSALGHEGSEIVTATLNSYFATMIGVITRTGGDLLGFGGDALLVLFTGPDHARTATAAAMALLHELDGFERSVPGVGRFPLTLHIGVEAGPLALVSAGPAHARRYSVMGATVSRVARAEDLGGAGELVLGPRAWAAVAAVADGQPLAAGFVRVHRLRHAPPPVPPSHRARVALPTSRAAAARLARQVTRLSAYLPSTLLSRVLADPARPRVEADLRPVTVLFAQVAGLGPLIEGLPPGEAAAAVDAVFSPLQAAVEHFGGFVNKLDLAEEGDKLMAVFGAPIAFEDHAERAARAALAMQGALVAPRALDHGQPGAGHALRLRIGLNTGNVFAGNVGAAERKEYTVMGDAVNVAARVMASTPWGELRCSRATAALVDHALVCADPLQVAARGKRAPLEVLRLVGERDSAAEPGDDTPLIGRAAELAWLRALWVAAARASRTVRISGEAGIGKSRLAAALVAEARVGGARVLSVRCLAYASATPYAPWGDLVRALCAIDAGDDQPTRARKLAASLEAAGVPVADWLPLVADLVRLQTADNAVVRTLDPQQRQARRFAIVLALLRAAARAAGSAGQSGGATLVISFDNLHWADQISRALWRYVATQLGDAPILLLGMHRGPLAWGDDGRDDGAMTLELAPLSPEAGAALLEARARPAALTPELRQRLVDRAAGNPLFLEELLRTVSEHPESVDTLPDSLSGLLLARIDRLDEGARALLRVAAVVGQRFPIGLVQSVHPIDEAALIHHLLRLDHAEITSTERERPERIHLFRHALLHEVAYQSLLYARRRELHRRIGEHLAERYADTLAHVRAQYCAPDGSSQVQIGRNGSLLSRGARADGAPIFLLAHHLRLSDTPERAVPYLLLAGHLARDSYANDQAVQYYRWVLEILAGAPEQPASWEAREALGDVLCTLGHYDAAQQEYATLLGRNAVGNAGRASLPPAVSAEVLRSWGEALEKQGRYSEALERLREAEALCQANAQAVPPLLLAAIHADMGQVLRRLGAFDAALEICRAGLALIQPDNASAEDERIAADLQTLMGTLFAMRGAYEAARDHFTQALAAQQAIDDLYGCARSHNNLGYLAQLQSDYQQAVDHYGQAEALARKVQTKYMLSSVLLNAAYASFCLSRYQDADRTCRDALALCEEMGDQLGVAQAADTLGMSAYQQGDYAAAAAHYQQALAIYRGQANSFQEGNTLALLARVVLAAGEVAVAHTLATEALAIARRVQAPQHEVEALTVLAEVALRASTHERASQLDEALAWASQAGELAERLGSRLDYGIARRLQGEIAAARNEPFAEHFDAALATFTAINSAFEQACTEARYGAILARSQHPDAGAYLKRAEATFRKIGAAGELRRMGAGNERSS